MGKVEKKADGHPESDPVHTSPSSSNWVVLAPDTGDAPLRLAFLKDVPVLQTIGRHEWECLMQKP